MAQPQQPATYLISFTAGGLLHEETISLAPYYNDDKIESISEQIVNNSLLKTNSQASRQRIIQEIRKRYFSVGEKFYGNFDQFTIVEQKLVIFYSCMKTYKILFDFMLDVIIEKWLSMDLEVDIDDVERFLDKKSNVQNDIEDWSSQTRRKIITVLIRMLNEVGMLENNKLVQIEASDEFWRMFVANNDSWFLEAGLLSKEQREKIING
jgi:hypothetical protein